MAIYDLRGLDLDFVIHYGGDDSRINAFTFANSLTALGTALQAANREINPDFSLEVSVVALGGGSFRPHIKAKAKRLGGLLLGDVRQGIVGAVAALILTRCLGEPDPQVVVLIDRIEIHTGGGDVIILPLDLRHAYERVQSSSDVGRAITQTFEAIEEDDEVTSYGFARTPAEPPLRMPFNLPRDRFADVARPRLPLTSRERETIERDERLQIVRVIFENSARRWQFVWRGVRISAPVLDVEFRHRLMAGEEAFRNGDVLVVDLRIVQRADAAGIWVNEAYEVLTVKGHERFSAQQDLLSR